jgi:hypothetical protein
LYPKLPVINLIFMELSYEEYLTYQTKNVILMLNNQEEKQGEIQGFRQDEKGEINFLLIKESETIAVELKDISKIILS